MSLATEPVLEAAGEVAPRSIVAEYAALIRPRVATMVFVVTLIGALIASVPLGGGNGSVWRALEAASYVTLITGCASVLNQVLERDTDKRMERTRLRPLVVGSVAVPHAILFAVVQLAAGTVGLALSFNLLAALLAVSTLVAYVAVYTPLKRVSTLNTVVGAIPGAAPPLLGYVAITGSVEPWAWMLFGTLFVWQFPHFLAIAWLYREDYARAGLKMLPAVPGSRGIAGRSALVHAAVLLPVSLLPAVRGDAGALYAIGALVLGLAYLAVSAAFALRENRPRARAVVLVSLAYLPLLFSLILFDPAVHSALMTR